MGNGVKLGVTVGNGVGVMVAVAVSVGMRVAVFSGGAETVNVGRIGVVVSVMDAWVVGPSTIPHPPINTIIIWTVSPRRTYRMDAGKFLCSTIMGAIILRCGKLTPDFIYCE